MSQSLPSKQAPDVGNARRGHASPESPLVFVATGVLQPLILHGPLSSY